MLLISKSQLLLKAQAVAVKAAVQKENMGPVSAYVLDLLLSCDTASVKGANQAAVVINYQLRVMWYV